MSQRCKFCFTKSDETVETCPVCRIPHDRIKKDLAKEEKKVWRATRSLNVVGLLICAAGLVGVLGFLPAVAMVGEMFVPMAISVFLVFFGYSLNRYKRWCYYAGIVTFSAAVVASFLYLNPILIIISVMFLYAVVSPTSRKLFHRQL
jgi:hypothetical protein